MHLIRVEVVVAMELQPQACHVQEEAVQVGERFDLRIQVEVVEGA